MNKKSLSGIKVIATVILGAVVLSSCSHDEYYYSEENVEKIANEKYAIAFEKAFGKVGPHVDWGFSSKKANTRAFTRAGEVAFKTTITFPDYCNDSDFKDAVPATGVDKLPDEGIYGGTHFIDKTTSKVDLWGVGTLYVTETVDLSNSSFNVNTGSKIYLVNGSTLILSEESAENLKGEYYIAANATLKTSGLLKLNSGAKVYTHGDGTIDVKDLEVNSTSLLYNKGTLKATGTVSAESNSIDGITNLSYIVNGGNIICADVVVNAGAVLNYFKWNVTGTTHVNSNNSGWINNDEWTTKNFAYVGGSENVINNCLLTVTNDFDMNVSSLSASGNQAFKINSGGSVVTENFYGGRNLANNQVEGGPFRINMAEYALFKVNNKATLESGRGEGFGFFGPSSTSTNEYAVFQAKSIARDPYLESIKSHGAVTYGGKLYVSAETHFEQGYDSDGSGSYEPKPFIYEHDGFSIDNNIYAADFKAGKPNITIPETTCSPGFIGGDPLYRVIAEDLSAAEFGDFDFNDVVFDVVKAENGKTTLKLICAGGVLPLRVRGANEAEGTEIHSVFGETVPNAKGQYKMYNTGAGPTVPAATFTVEGEYTTPEEIANIIIEVKKDNVWMNLPANQGEAACKILVDDTFKPVRERSNIADENQKFTNYVQGSFVDDFWWK